MEIAEFLLARIAEDERAAREMVRNKRWLGECGEPHDERIQIGDNWTFDGPRLLAECQAKVRIVDELRDIDDGHVWAATEASRAESVLHALAAVYADHPDYERAWAPLASL